MDREGLQARQAPLKQQYRSDPDAALLRLTAVSEATAETPLVCSVNVGNMVFEVAAHPGVGGPGEAGCSGEQLLAALAACAQITLRMVAMSMDVEVESVRMTVQGDLDLRGTMGMDPSVPTGFQHIALNAEIVSSGDQRQQRVMERLVERTCVVLNTLRKPPPIDVTFTYRTPADGAP